MLFKYTSSSSSNILLFVYLTYEIHSLPLMHLLQCSTDSYLENTCQIYKYDLLRIHLIII